MQWPIGRDLGHKGKLASATASCPSLTACPWRDAGALEEAGMQAPGRQPRGGDLQLNGTLRSASCGLVIRIGAATTHLAEHYAKAMRYTACMTALTLLQV